MTKMTSDAPDTKFDCVQFMREARDRISAKIAGMNAEEINEYFNAKEYADPWLQTLSDRAEPPAIWAERARRATRSD